MSLTYMTLTGMAGETPAELTYASSKDKKWTPMRVFWLILIIIFVVLWLAFIAGAFYSTMNRSAMERVFSMLMAIFLPEFWLCYHGIDAGRADVGFFQKLPRISK